MAYWKITSSNAFHELFTDISIVTLIKSFHLKIIFCYSTDYVAVIYKNILIGKFTYLQIEVYVLVLAPLFLTASVFV